MNGFILAAGFGKRMGDLTLNLPKPLLPFKNRPLIDYSLFLLHRAGVRECVINLHYLGGKIRDHLEGFPHFPIHFSEEDPILGTAGGIRTGLSFFSNPDDSMIVTNPDTLMIPTEQDLKLLKDFTSGSLLMLKPKSPDSKETGFQLQARDAGDFPVSTPGLIQSNRPNGSFYYYIGLSVLDPKIVSHLHPGKLAELGPIFTDPQNHSNLSGAIFGGEIVDLGTRTSYEKALAAELPPGYPEQEWLSFIKTWEN